jgi:hypothetical protein
MGVKVDTEVGLRASDHCRLAVAGAKASLLRRREAQGAVSASETKAGLGALHAEASRLLAETARRRSSLHALFGERCANPRKPKLRPGFMLTLQSLDVSRSDDRTAAADALLSGVSEDGILAMEEALHAIGEHSRLLQLGGDDVGD